MACERFRELISVRLDGEADADDVAVLEEHLESCVGCQAFAYRAERLQRPLRMEAIGAVPDLTGRLMASLPPVRRPLHLDLARVGLAAIALTQLVFAVPQLLAADTTEPVHTARHLGSWDLAFAIGLLVVAWMPRRARGLLPMATALAAAMVATAVIDLFNGHAAGVAEASHVLEIAGVLLVWVLARSAPPEIGPDRLARRRGFALPRVLAPPREGLAFGPVDPPTGFARAQAREQTAEIERAA